MSELRQKLREKRSMLNMARRPGANAQVNQAFARLGPAGLSTESQKEMLQEVKDNMRGLRKKDAKKKFRQVSELLSDDQSQTFDRLVSQSFPEQRDQIKAMANQGRKAKQEKEQKRQAKMQAVPNYVPQAGRPQDQTPTRTGRGRSFERVDIAIPKLQELPNWSAPPAPSSSSSGLGLPPPPSVQKRSPQAIQQLFQPAAPPCPIDSRPLPWEQRLTLLKQFTPHQYVSLTKEWQQWMLSHGQSEDLKRMGEVRVLPMSCLALPFSETVVTRQEFEAYTRLSDRERKASAVTLRADGSEVFWQGQNGYHQYQRFLLHFLPLIAWLRTLKGQNVPWRWLVEKLKPLGVLAASSTQTNDFQLMEHVYHDKDQHVTPLLPFVSIHLQS